MPTFDTSPLHQFPKLENFLWVCWFLGKNHSNFVPPNWKLDNPYYHSQGMPKNVLRTFDTSFDRKMMVKSSSTEKNSNQKIPFRVTSPGLTHQPVGKTFCRTLLLHHKPTLVMILFQSYVTELCIVYLL